MSGDSSRPRSIDDYEATVLVSRPVEDEPTQLYRPGRAEPAEDVSTSGREAMEDPPARLAGHRERSGKGQRRPVGIRGQPHRPGRDRTGALDYGDALISRSGTSSSPTIRADASSTCSTARDPTCRI